MTVIEIFEKALPTLFWVKHSRCMRSWRWILTMWYQNLHFFRVYNLVSIWISFLKLKVSTISSLFSLIFPALYNLFWDHSFYDESVPCYRKKAFVCPPILWCGPEEEMIPIKSSYQILKLAFNFDWPSFFACKPCFDICCRELRKVIESQRSFKTFGHQNQCMCCKKVIDTLSAFHFPLEGQIALLNTFRFQNMTVMQSCHKVSLNHISWGFDSRSVKLPYTSGNL